MVQAELEVRGKLRAMAKETAHVSLRVRWKVIARAKVKESVRAKAKEHARAMGRVRVKKTVRENVVFASIDEIMMWKVLSQSQHLRVGREQVEGRYLPQTQRMVAEL